VKELSEKKLLKSEGFTTSEVFETLEDGADLLKEIYENYPDLQIKIKHFRNQLVEKLNTI